MPDDTLPRPAYDLMNRFRQLQALTLASIQVARDRLDTLTEATNEDDTENAAQPVDFQRRIDRLQTWLFRAQQELAWLDEQSHRVGVLIEKVRMGVVAPESEPLRRLSQLMSQKHQEVALEALEHLGRGNFNRADDLGADLLVDQSEESDSQRLETTEEFEQLMSQVGLAEDDTIDEEDDRDITTAAEIDLSTSQ
jgi:CO dehydrogenase nickel-insertion accessory protein CooC1